MLFSLASRWWLALAVVALLVSVPVARCQDEVEDSAEEPAATAAPAGGAAAAAGEDPLAPYKALAFEYLNTAQEMAVKYGSQAQEMAKVGNRVQ